MRRHAWFDIKSYFHGEKAMFCHANNRSYYILIHFLYLFLVHNYSLLKFTNTTLWFMISKLVNILKPQVVKSTFTLPKDILTAFLHVASVVIFQDLVLTSPLLIFFNKYIYLKKYNVMLNSHEKTYEP